ncbi:MAG TPA: CopG family transcriptional regulator [Acidimicrobiales bacterium]
MVRRQVLVQLDDELVARLDRLAHERGTNRSDLIRQGALAVLDADSQRQADRQLQVSYQYTPQDPLIVEAAGRLARETIPNW